MTQNPTRLEPALLDSDAPVPELLPVKGEIAPSIPAQPPLFPLAEMASLHQRIRAACPTERGLVVEVIAPQPKAGTTSVAYGLASVAAQLSGQRVLLCDGTGTGDALRLNKVVMRRNLERLAAYEGFSIPVGLVACALDSDVTQYEMIAAVHRYGEALRKFRAVFDLIVIDVPASNASDLGPALAKYVDASIVVVETNKTRAPLVKSLLSAITTNGGRAAGIVLNRRVQYIPNFIYRWL
jgi:Mrp family chromosome partitioning ATPase